MFDYTGTRYNFTVLEKVETQKRFAFYDRRGEGFDVSDVTWEVRLVGSEGEEEGGATAMHAEGAVNKLMVSLPSMGAGTYDYEVVAKTESGEVDVVVAGLVTVKSRAAADKIVEEAASAEESEMRVVVPDEVGKVLLLKWQGSSFVQGYAEAAKDAADRAENAEQEAEKKIEEAVKEATEKAENAADRAEAAADRAEEKIEEAVGGATERAEAAADRAEREADRAEAAVDEVKGSAKELADEVTEEIREQVSELVEDTEETRRSADATVQKLEVFLAKFGDNVRSVVWVDPETEHLFIGGEDTGCKVTGEDGKSPYVDENGDWQYWDDESKQWRNGGPARGEDGFAPYLDAEGYLVYKDPLTGEVVKSVQPLKGKDGLDARQVRRVIVGSKDEIPTEGETCGGGFYYYVPLDDMPPVAIFAPKGSRTRGGEIKVNGKAVSLPGASMGAAEAAEALAGSLRVAFPEATVEVDSGENTVILIGDEEYWSVEGLPEEDWGLTVHVRMKREGYDVYAWLETPEGEASWVHVGEANDLATTELYGLTKLGTDLVVQGGAPVGTNEKGQMRVPGADMGQSGTVKLSLNGQIEENGGGGIGVDAQGRIWVQEATRTEYGAVKTSYTGSQELTPSVGMNEEGQLVIPYASLNNPGVVNLGSYGGQANPIPYILSVGMDELHRLANNLVYSGALQHMNPQGWRARNLPWLDKAMAENPEYFQDIFYMGVVTSEQFTQTPEEGIVLNSASATLKAGVFLATGMDDQREDAVPTAEVVQKWAGGEFYTKGEVDDKLKEVTAGTGDVQKEMEDKLKDEVGKMDESLQGQAKTLNDRITSEVGKLNDTIKGEVGKLNQTIADKEKGLGDRINANAEKFKNYKTWNETVEYLKGYATQAWVRANFLSLEDFSKEKKAINESIEGCVKKTTQWKGNVYLTEAEYNSLKEIDPLIEYNILGNSH